MTPIKDLKDRIAKYEAKLEDANRKMEVLRADRLTYERIIDELHDIITSISKCDNDEPMSKNTNSIKGIIEENKVRLDISQYLPEFPTNSSREHQILWIIESVFGRAAKRSDVESFYFSCLGGDAKPIKFVFRGMVLRGDLVGNKYNSNNKLTFYGLPEWVDKDECFESEYLPSGFGTDFKVDSVEVVAYNEDEEAANEVINILNME